MSTPPAYIARKRSIKKGALSKAKDRAKARGQSSSLHRRTSQEVIADRRKKVIDDQKAAGLFPCRETCPISGVYCSQRAYKSQKWLTKHMSKGKHTFPRITARDQRILLSKAHLEQSAAVGVSVANAAALVSSNCTMASDESADTSWLPKPGLFRKGSERPALRKTPLLLYHLTALFRAGVLSKSAMVTPKNAVDALRRLRVPKGIHDEGRRLLHSRSIYGPMPPRSTVKSWFSSTNAGSKKQQQSIDPRRRYVKARPPPYPPPDC